MTIKVPIKMIGQGDRRINDSDSMLPCFHIADTSLLSFALLLI
jgi:hypothetical protein